MLKIFLSINLFYVNFFHINAFNINSSILPSMSTLERPFLY